MMTIYWAVRSVLILCCCLAAMPAESSGGSTSPGSTPDHTTPRALAEAWLRFHETDLCQGVDAVFVFLHEGIEVTGKIIDGKSYDRFQELLQPLKASYKIELRLEQPEKEENTEAAREKDPPASLWENYELRSFLGDPFARARERAGFEDDTQQNFPPADDLLKQRLFIYAEQTLSWSAELERYAKHLPLLTRMATDSRIAHEMRSQANGIAAAHTKQMDRLLGKLAANLVPALPHSGKAKQTFQPEKNASSGKSVVDRADSVSDFAQSVSLRVYQFIHPEHYTVGLNELRQPSLLESIKDLQKMDSDFLKALAKSK